jgi:hypothetical protein
MLSRLSVVCYLLDMLLLSWRDYSIGFCLLLMLLLLTFADTRMWLESI